MKIDYDTLFCLVDDFCKGFEPWYKKQLISDGTTKRNRSCHLSLAETLTILIAYHQSGRACFKYFYLDLLNSPQKLFPKLVHYARFVKLIKRAFPALVCLLKSLEGEITQYLFIDSTPMAVCHNLREKRHKTFKGLAAKGKTSTGWFFGMKLHMIFNTKGEIIRLTITPGNVNDRTPVPHMVRTLEAKLIGDKGYLSKKLFQELFENGVTLITKIKKNMKDRLMEMTDKLMLMRRFFVETIFSSMKALRTLIHHRHRCPVNAVALLFAGLINYPLRADKPTLHSLTNFLP
jgi:hypothetical protein